MASTLLVLAIVLICQPLVCIAVLVAIFQLTKRNGQALKSMSWHPRHGLTAQFFKKRTKSGHNRN